MVTRTQEDKSNYVSTMQVSAHFPNSKILLTKANDTAEPKVKKWDHGVKNWDQ